MICNLSRLCCSSAVENLPSLQEALVQFPARQKQYDNLILLLLRIFWYSRGLVSKSSANRLQSYLKEQIKIKEALWGAGRGLGSPGTPMCLNRRGSLSDERYSVRHIPDILCFEPSLVPCGLQHTFGLNYSLICLSVCGVFALGLGPGEWKEGISLSPPLTPGQRPSQGPLFWAQ